ncbi:hypothetical protein BC937DRAFT_89896 [Endogone sp. FLAS-F59071]|nr:hypothetical protein BC937DRAFT_89896 [Endogone sp. FLAS-F59071]|eukprot:RUS17503.1 hypothetical protein BC937DRAFT_89896 [Endogone sp. FLAS-F59071]
MSARKSTDSARSTHLHQLASVPLQIQRPRSANSKKRAPSISSVRSTTSSVDQPWPISASFDQLNFFNRRASISSTNLLKTGSFSTISTLEAVELQLKERVKKATFDTSLVIKSMLNDASVGLYRVTEHIQKKVPAIVDEKLTNTVIHNRRDTQRSLAALAVQVDCANSDVSDARKTVTELLRNQCINSVGEMLRKSIELVEAAKKTS